MRSRLLFVLLVFSIIGLYGQNYYKIVFAGNPETVIAENITQGKIVGLLGSDTLLLKLKATGLKEIDNSTHKLTIYPNPMDQSCSFDFENKKYGKVNIQLYNAQGRLIYEYNKKLQKGIQQFQLSGVPSGVYVINIKTETCHYYGSFVSTDKSNAGFLLIDKNETSGKIVKNQNGEGLNLSDIEDLPLDYRSKVEMDFAIGDKLRFVGHKGGFKNDTVYASPTGDQTITFAFCTRPAQPSAIIGNSSPCQCGSELIYSVTNVSDVEYTWTVPPCWTISSGQGTNTITVIPSNSSGNITVTPSNDCGNGPMQSLEVTIQFGPEQPSPITGNNSPCQGATGLNYSVISVPDVKYLWIVPEGWTLTSGQGTNSITVTAGSASGKIILIPSNDCGFGAAQTLDITTQSSPVQPSVISGNNNPCQGATGLIYSVTSVSGVSYTWTIPLGWTIISGQNTNSITVTSGTSSGNITVTPSNTCGNGTAQTLAINTQNVLGQPSAIIGNDKPCQGSTGLIYYVINIAGVTYTWTVPSGWTITAGQGTNSIIVTVGSTNGNITVIPSNSCGSGTAQTLAVTTQAGIAQPSVIDGADLACQGEPALIYSVINVAGLTYTWTVPSDWIIISGQGTNSIIVTAGATSGEIIVIPSNDCGNGAAQTLFVNILPVPAQPSMISGNDNPCQGTSGLVYSVNDVPNVTFNWYLPNGWIINSGQGTNSIEVTAGPTSTVILVKPSNDCGNGNGRIMAVSVQFDPEQPSVINGNINPCQGSTGLIYSVTNISDVIYTWSVPTGWTITSGQSTNSITVNVGSASGNITVTPSNTCGNGTAQTMAVTTQTSPAQPSAISGNNNPCQGSTGLNYSVTNVVGVTYTWSVPSGWTITAGQGSNSITVTVGSSSGNISVIPSNTCGNGNVQTLAVTTQNLPAQPSAITGNNNPCQGTTGLNYSVTNVAGITYTWTVPSGWMITAGQGTSNIIVTAGTISGNISVTPSNICGNGTAQTMAVTTQTVPGQPTAGTHVPSETQIVWNWNTSAGATGYKYNTVNNYSTASDNGASTTFTQTGLTCNTSYTLYVWAYNSCGNSSALSMAQNTSACPFICGTSTVTFTYNGSSVTYGTVVGANNRCWLDRNLGASQVATSKADAAAFGDLFQWGRLDDGHQVRTSPTTNILSNSDVPGHGSFITVSPYPYDWRSPQNPNLWQGVNGINNTCPTGYRLPIESEWNGEKATWNTNNTEGAFASPLKLTAAGGKDRVNGVVGDVGNIGFYWASNVGEIESFYLYINPVDSYINDKPRASGLSVRCIKD